MSETTEPPLWRRDFPYTTAGEEQVTRREFARFLVLASAAFAAGTAVIAGWTSIRKPLRGTPTELLPLDDLPVGGSYVFNYPSRDHPAIMLRLDDDVLVAFSQKCTHLGCTVFHEPERAELVCPCHEGFFDERTGEVTAGPPELPLPKIELEVRDGTIWALGTEPH
ncbi:MAG TPA: Rieske (2Fe-2S) protein [Egicoccus sp.]|nr:Rieske (2Fe-2S) protein [Egicoccus sp.]HSK23999.1 Rieske (2Fe-2S) protein [Egicoccus sp.]